MLPFMWVWLLGVATYLSQDMLPRSRRAQPDQFVIQGSSHRLDPAAHVLQIALPFLPQLLGAKDRLDNV